MFKVSLIQRERYALWPSGNQRNCKSVSNTAGMEPNLASAFTCPPKRGGFPHFPIPWLHFAAASRHFPSEMLAYHYGSHKMDGSFLLITGEDMFNDY